MRRIELIYEKTENGYRHKWIVDEGIPVDFGEDLKPIYRELRFREANGGNEIVTKTLCQMAHSGI